MTTSAVAATLEESTSAPLVDAGAATPPAQRIAALDVVRGIAVAGILFANVIVFFGNIFIPPERLAAIGETTADRVSLYLMHVLVEGKFYSIFSLLFGIGFGVQLARRGGDAVPRFRRRLRVLLGIGAVHAFVIWSGDILMLYALLGFTMPWFARKDDAALLRWSVGLLATPTALYVVAVIAWMLVGSAPPPEASNSDAISLPPEILAIFAKTGTGGWKDAVISNLVNLAGRWVDLFVTMRFPKVLGMFVLGLWCVRRGIALDPSAHRALLATWCARGLGIGLAANILAPLVLDRWGYLPPTLGGLAGTALQAIGYPMLAIGYACGITLLVVNRHRLVGIFAPMGRMALTNYLTHSIVCVTLSRGFGFGLWWNVGVATTMLIATAIILVQLPLSAWWMSRYRFGPVEWVWRRLTYGVPI